ncbi:MAG: HdeD family acid-resistance protein [Burkholderiales bacterium]
MPKELRNVCSSAAVLAGLFEETPMKELLVRSWWMLALRGTIAILFGILALLWPGLTLLFLVAMFAAFAVLSGAVATVGAVKNRDSDQGWWLILLLGLISIGAGVIAIFYPSITALALVLVMGANALITGALDIAVAVRLRTALRGGWLLFLAGIASIVFGVFVFVFPGAGALALVWLISFYAIFTGTLLLAFAFRARAWANRETVGDLSAVHNR